MAIYGLWEKADSATEFTKTVEIDTGALSTGVSENLFAALVRDSLTNNGGVVEIRNNAGVVQFKATKLAT